MVGDPSTSTWRSNVFDIEGRMAAAYAGALAIVALVSFLLG